VAPPPKDSGNRNPQTSALSISFVIFGGVIVGGLAVYGLLTLNKKHVAQEKAYADEKLRQERAAGILERMKKK